MCINGPTGVHIRRGAAVSTRYQTAAGSNNGCSDKAENVVAYAGIAGIANPVFAPHQFFFGPPPGAVSTRDERLYAVIDRY
jgi:hypothetical protein